MSSQRMVTYHGTKALVGDSIQLMAQDFITAVPSSAVKAREERDGGSEYHCTIIAPAELKMVRGLITEATTPKSFELFTLGLAHVVESDGEAWYVVLYSPEIQRWRKSLDLPEKDLHITLGYHRNDPHGGGSQGLFASIAQWASIKTLLPCLNHVVQSFEKEHVQSMSTLDKQVLKQIVYMLLQPSANKSTTVEITSLERNESLRKVARFILNLSVISDNFELFSVVEDIGWDLMGQGLIFGIRILILMIINMKSIGMDFLLTHFPMKLHATLLKKDVQEIQRHVQELNELLMSKLNGWIENKKALVYDAPSGSINILNLPRNFSWVKMPEDESKLLLAGSAYPSKFEHLQGLKSIGIRHIITVHESGFAENLLKQSSTIGIANYHFDVNDRTPPSTEQVKAMMTIMHMAITRNEGVLIHCQGGVGRTNTVIIAYLMAIQELSAADGIQQVTNQRKLILSTSQQEFLRKWYRIVHEEQVLESTTTPAELLASTIKAEVPCEVESTATAAKSNVGKSAYAKVAAAMQMPPLIMLCGVPASGKSTFTKALVEAHPDFFTRINRDEIRGKGQCEKMLQDGLQNYLRANNGGGSNKKASKAVSVGHVNQVVLLDGCHVSPEKRKEWLDAAHNVPTWCIYFERPLGECEHRIRHRTDHPIIPAGETGITILKSMVKQWVAPSEKEAFQRIIPIRNDQEMKALLESWNIPFHPPHDSDDEDATIDASEVTRMNKPVKFPRTPHVVNLGAATRDDKIFNPADVETWIKSKVEAIVEEKIDGANIGFSIKSSEQRIVAQNRSHYISSAYHPQFALLDKWIAKHSQELWTFMEPDRHILYGEWMYATHSVSYNNLPDYFVAFDLYDTVTKTFLPRVKLAEVLAETTIPMINLVYEGKLLSLEHLKSLVYGPSAYGDQPREGIVVRIVNEDQLISRAKLVRPDFIAGNERWNRSSVLQTNSLKKMY